MKADYKAFCFDLMPKDRADTENKKSIRCKMLLQSDYDRNEQGQFISTFNEDDGQNVKIKSINTLRLFIKKLKKEEIITEDYYKVLSRIASSPLGIDLKAKTSDICLDCENPEIFNVPIAKVLKRISNKVKDLLRLYPCGLMPLINMIILK